VTLILDLGAVLLGSNLSPKIGNNVVEIPRGCKPHLVLTDVMMPGLDGFGLLHECQRQLNFGPNPQAISDTTLAAAGSLADYNAEFNERLRALSRVLGLLSRPR
jgi:CheY-like chemotaxis protein